MSSHSLFSATSPDEAHEIYREIKEEFGGHCEIQFGILEKVPPASVECLIFVNGFKVQFHGSEEALSELQDLVVRERMKKVKWL